MIERSAVLEHPEPDLDAGARAIGSFVRPYPIAISGIPVSLDFDTKTSVFRLTVDSGSRASQSIEHPTEIFLPNVHYGSERSSKITLLADVKQSTEHDQSSHRSNLMLWLEDQPDVEVEVEINSGRYEVKGNILKWYHEASGEAKQTISIKRSGGPRRRSAVASRSQSLWRDAVDGICSCNVS